MKVTKVNIEELIDALYLLLEESDYVDVEAIYSKNTLKLTPVIQEKTITAA